MTWGVKFSNFLLYATLLPTHEHANLWHPVLLVKELHVDCLETTLCCCLSTGMSTYTFTCTTCNYAVVLICCMLIRKWPLNSIQDQFTKGTWILVLMQQATCWPVKIPHIPTGISSGWPLVSGIRHVLHWTHEITNSMKKIPSWEANRSSASQEIPRILRNAKVHYCIFKSPPPVHMK